MEKEDKFLRSGKRDKQNNTLTWHGKRFQIQNCAIKSKIQIILMVGVSTPKNISKLHKQLLCIAAIGGINKTTKKRIINTAICKEPRHNL